MTDLDQSEVKALVDAWYKALDVHAPVDQVVAMVAADGLECYWPEGPTSGSTSSRAGTTGSPTPSSTKSTR